MPIRRRRPSVQAPAQLWLNWIPLWALSGAPKGCRRWDRRRSFVWTSVQLNCWGPWKSAAKPFLLGVLGCGFVDFVGLGRCSFIWVRWCCRWDNRLLPGSGNLAAPFMEDGCAEVRSRHNEALQRPGETMHRPGALQRLQGFAIDSDLSNETLLPIPGRMPGALSSGLVRRTRLSSSDWTERIRSQEAWELPLLVAVRVSAFPVDLRCEPPPMRDT